MKEDLERLREQSPRFGDERFNAQKSCLLLRRPALPNASFLRWRRTRSDKARLVLADRGGTMGIDYLHSP